MQQTGDGESCGYFALAYLISYHKSLDSNGICKFPVFELSSLEKYKSKITRDTMKLKTLINSPNDTGEFDISNSNWLNWITGALSEQTFDY